MKEEYFNQRFLGTVYIEEDDLLIENTWLTITQDEMYFETSVNLPKRKSWSLMTASFNKVDDSLTLLNCETKEGYSRGIAGQTQKVFFKQLLFGLKLSGDQLKFKGIVLVSPAFTRWVQQTDRIEYSKNYLKAKIPERKVIEKVVTDEYKLRLISDFAIMANGDEFYAKHQMAIKLTVTNTKSVDELIRISNKIRKFILFVTNQNPEFSHLTLLDENKYKLPMWVNSKHLNEKKFSQNLWIRYLHTRKHLADILMIWLSDEKLELAVDLILSRQFNTTMSSSAFFFNTCVALESNFDRFRKLNYENHSKTAQKKIDSISELIQKQRTKDWFENKAKFWKDPILRRKFEKYKPTISAIGSNTFPYSMTKLLDRIVATRNDIAHRGESKNCFSDVELFLAGKLLEFTFKIELLKYFNIEVESKQNNLLRAASAHLRMLATKSDYNIIQSDDEIFKLKGKP